MKCLSLSFRMLSTGLFFLCATWLTFHPFILSGQHRAIIQNTGNLNRVTLMSGQNVVFTIPCSPCQPAVGEPIAVNPQEKIAPGANWVMKFSATGKVFKDVSFADAQAGYIVTELGAVFKSTDGGDNWISVMDLGFPYYWYGVHALSPDTVVISGFNNQSSIREGVVRWSYDGGTTWGPDINLTIPVNGVGWLDRVHFFNAYSGIVINSFSGGCWYTLDGGKNAASWNYVSVNPDLGWFGGNIDAQASGRVYATGIHFAHSADFGVNWVSGLSADSIFDGGVDFLDFNNMLGWTGGGLISTPVSGWVHRTLNGGLSWGQRLKTFTWPIRAVKFLTRTNGWVAGGNLYNEAGGIYGTNDGGLTWNLEANTSAEMFSFELKPVTEDSIDIWCVGSTGGSTGYTGKLYKTRLGSTITGIDNNPTSPAGGFSLCQSSPNPSGGATTIGFTIPARCFVSLKIYDVYGKMVATLLHEMKEPGYQSIRFDGSLLPDGIYFYQLITENYSATKKMILHK
ncbi:MAG: T9SS type A sorting domain-containing protein [Bacteroidota bacterium]